MVTFLPLMGTRYEVGTIQSQTIQGRCVTIYGLVIQPCRYKNGSKL